MAQATYKCYGCDRPWSPEPRAALRQLVECCMMMRAVETLVSGTGGKCAFAYLLDSLPRTEEP